jgi:plastocyanin
MKTAFHFAVLSAMSFVGASAAAASVSIQVSDSNGKALSDVVVMVDPQAGSAAPKLLKGAEIEQRGLKFLPLVSVIQTGSRIAFPNYDRVKHHIYSFSPAKKFDQKLYSGVAAAPQVFDKAGLVVLGCNIHDRMVAYVKVVDTPYFAKTDAAGVARIDLPPAGKFTVSAWHYNESRAAAEQALTLKAGEAPAALAFKLTLKAPLADADAGVE